MEIFDNHYEESNESLIQKGFEYRENIENCSSCFKNKNLWVKYDGGDIEYYCPHCKAHYVMSNCN